MPNTSLGFTYPASTGHTRIWEHIQTLAQTIDDFISGGRVSGSRIATTVIAAGSDSAGVTTTETSLGSVTASLVAGRTYRLRYMTRIGTDTANAIALVRIREDTVAGNELVGDNVVLPNTGSAGQPAVAEGEYTATATGSKTFHLTLARASASGTLRREGSFMPTYLYIDYIRG